MNFPTKFCKLNQIRIPANLGHKGLTKPQNVTTALLRNCTYDFKNLFLKSCLFSNNTQSTESYSRFNFAQNNCALLKNCSGHGPKLIKPKRDCFSGLLLGLKRKEMLIIYSSHLKSYCYERCKIQGQCVKMHTSKITTRPKGTEKQYNKINLLF